MMRWHIAAGLIAASVASVPVATTTIRHPQHDQVAGRATIIDGDTIIVAGRRVRLFGMDAFERTQRCAAPGGGEFACGERAQEALSEIVAGRHLECQGRDIDRYRRLVAVCRAGRTDIGAEMVRRGWAIAFTRYSLDYLPQEASARRRRRGAWAGTFILPEAWRRSER